MKSNMLKFKAFALSLVLVLTLFACSDDGDDEPLTFLEKNGGTTWTISKGGVTVYAQINNNETNPFEFWTLMDEWDCYEYMSIEGDGNIDIIENTEDKLEVRIDDSDSEYRILTLTISGNSLAVRFESFKDGVADNPLLFTMQKTDEDPDDLTLCESFLETNGGTVWNLNLGGESIYAQINNSESSPIEFWFPGEDEMLCYEHETVIGIGGIEVLENTVDVLKVKVADGDNDHIIMTFTISGNILVIKSEYYEDGDLEDTELIPLQKTTDDPDDLPLCTS